MASYKGTFGCLYSFLHSRPQTRMHRFWLPAHLFVAKKRHFIALHQELSRF